MDLCNIINIRELGIAVFFSVVVANEGNSQNIVEDEIQIFSFTSLVQRLEQLLYGMATLFRTHII